MITYPGCENMIPPPDLLFYFFRVGKLSINFQKIFRGLRYRTLIVLQRFYQIKVFHSENIKFFSRVPTLNPPIFNWFALDRPDSPLRYETRIKYLKSVIKFKFFILKMSKFFPRAPPTDLQSFFPKSFRVGKKNKRSGGESYSHNLGKLLEHFLEHI